MIGSKSKSSRFQLVASNTPEIAISDQFNTAIDEENQRAARFDTQYKKYRNSIMLRRDEATKHLNNLKKSIGNHHHRHVGNTIRKRTYSHSKANHQTESSWLTGHQIQRKNSFNGQDVKTGDSMEFIMRKYEKISQELSQMDHEIDRLDNAIKANRKQQDTNVNALTIKRESALAKFR